MRDFTIISIIFSEVRDFIIIFNAIERNAKIKLSDIVTEMW